MTLKETKLFSLLTGQDFQLVNFGMEVSSRMQTLLLQQQKNCAIFEVKKEFLVQVRASIVNCMYMQVVLFVFSVMLCLHVHIN